MRDRVERGEQIALSYEQQFDLGARGAAARIGYGGLRFALLTIPDPSDVDLQQREQLLVESARSLFLGGVQDPLEQLLSGSQLSGELEEVVGASKELLIRVAEFVYDWNDSDPLSGKHADVLARSYHERPLTSRVFTKVTDGRSARLTLNNIGLRPLFTSEGALDLVIASDPHGGAVKKIEPETVLPLHMLTNPHPMGGLAVSTLDIANQSKVRQVEPVFTIHPAI